MIKKCAHCGNEFEASRANVKFCSNDCIVNARKVYNTQKRREYRNMRKNYMMENLPPRICPVCGNTFKVEYLSQATCSKECSMQRLLEQRKQASKRFNDKKK